MKHHNLFVTLLSIGFLHVPLIFLAMECPICFDTLKNGNEVAITACAHSFHTSCVKEYLTSHNACPQCMQTQSFDDLRVFDSQSYNVLVAQMHSSFLEQAVDLKGKRKEDEKAGSAKQPSEPNHDLQQLRALFDEEDGHDRSIAREREKGKKKVDSNKAIENEDLSSWFIVEMDDGQRKEGEDSKGKAKVESPKGKDSEFALNLFASLRRQAEQGDLEAQFKVGMCYKYSYGVKADEEQHVTWLRKAAERGHVRAQYHLGVYYTFDQPFKIIPWDREGMPWIKRAAKQGFAPAENRLAYGYYDGAGVEKNYYKAYKWAERAAAKGHPSALYNVAYSYHRGRVNERLNDDLALKYYKRACKAGHPHSFLAISRLLKGEQAAKYLKRGAKLGDFYCSVLLADYYADGSGGFEKNKVESEKWRNISSEILAGTYPQDDDTHIDLDALIKECENRDYCFV